MEESRSVESKSEKTSKREKSVKLSDNEVNKTELAFVTSVNYVTGQFFGQFCKFSNEELLLFNQAINDYCQRIISQREAGNQLIGVPAKVRKGNIFCVMFFRDKVWYRVQVLEVLKAEQSCTVRFIDYGNEEVVGADELLEVNPKELPIITRAPFGITCIAQDYENNTNQEKEQLLDCLHNNYVMIKPTTRLVDFEWKVRIPRHAYNMPFWLIFNPDKDGNAGAQKSGQSKIDSDDSGESRESQIALTATK